MKRKLLLFLLGATFLVVSVRTNTHLIASDTLLLTAFGLSCSCINNLIIRLWFGSSRFTQLHLTTYLVLLCSMLTLRMHLFDNTLSEHQSVAALNHLINLMKSPVPLMIMIPSLILKQQRSQ